MCWTDENGEEVWSHLDCDDMGWYCWNMCPMPDGTTAAPPAGTVGTEAPAK